MGCQRLRSCEFIHNEQSLGNKLHTSCTPLKLLVLALLALLPRILAQWRDRGNLYEKERENGRQHYTISLPP